MNISKVSEFSILPYNQNRKLGNLGNMSLTSNSDCSYNSRFENNKNKHWAETWRFPIWFKRKNKNFRDFWFCPIPKIENSEILEIFLLLQVLTVLVTEYLKENDLRQNLNGCVMV